MRPLELRASAPGLPEDLWTLREDPLTPVRVAVLDSGIDATHPWLAGRVEEAWATEDDEGSCSVVQRDPSAHNDVFGHGTAVGSIIAGIAPNARLIDVRVLESGSTGSGTALVAGLEYAVRRGFPVVNMSLAATAKFAALLHRLVRQAYRQGQVVTAAKRNMPLVDNGYPAEFSDTVSVDSLDTDRLAHVLYRPGEPIEFAAQGEEVRVAAAGGGYTIRTGTSLATPVVSGVVALLLGANPTLRPFEIKTLLKMYS